MPRPAQHAGPGGRVCAAHALPPLTRRSFLVKCKYINLATAKHELTLVFEVCKISRMDITGVKLKRVKGDTWQYKKARALSFVSPADRVQLCQELLQEAKL